jgi:integrase
MPRKGKRKRIARGIYEDSTGRCGIYRDALGKQREHRVPPHTPISVIRKEVADLRAKQKGSGRVASDRGTLNAAIDRWAGLEQHLASWKERRAELRAWAKLYGHIQLRAIDSDDIRRAISTWSQAGIAPKTIRNRMWTLGHLYRVLHGHDVTTPVDHIEPPAVPRRVINPTTPDTILKVYAKLIEAEANGTLRDMKTRARFMVRAASGRRPCEIMRAQPEDLDLERRIWRVRDAKGGWSEGLYLNDDLLGAWQLFAKADAWGWFHTGSMAKVLRTAGWPSGVRPYNLRHSLGIGLSELGVDFADVAGWLGHTDVRTTRRAYVPVLQSRMERASRAIDGRLGGWAQPVPASVPAGHATEPAKLHNIQDGRKAREKQQKAG